MNNDNTSAQNNWLYLILPHDFTNPSVIAPLIHAWMNTHCTILYRLNTIGVIHVWLCEWQLKPNIFLKFNDKDCLQWHYVEILFWGINSSEKNWLVTTQFFDQYALIVFRRMPNSGRCCCLSRLLINLYWIQFLKVQKMSIQDRDKLGWTKGSGQSFEFDNKFTPLNEIVGMILLL